MSVNWPGKPVSWNPVIGCGGSGFPCEARCWARGIARQFPVFQSVSAWDGTVRQQKCLDVPLRRRKPTVYAVCLMGDLFHESVPFKWIDRVFATTIAAPQHRYILLTKRAKRLRDYGWGDMRPPVLQADNLWLGVTVCNQAEADERIPLLNDMPAAHRWISYEPALGPLDLCRGYGQGGGEFLIDYLKAVVVGCESGPSRRPCPDKWLDDVAAQCKDAGVPCFIKQRSVNGKVVHCSPPADWPWVTS